LIGGFLDFFGVHWRGITVLVLLLLAAGVFVQWFTWIFAKGRFQRREGPADRQTLRYVFADLLVKIIDDFRHLLALVIVLIFALALTYALVLVAYEPTARIDATGKALQAVVSSLGGLIGAIIGYYFGEKAGERAAAAQTQTLPAAVAQAPAGPAAQSAPAPGAPAGPPIQPAPPPPGNPP
jgi:hypothetical protein